MVWLLLAGPQGRGGDYTCRSARSTAGPDDDTQLATVRPCGQLGTLQPRYRAATSARPDAGRLTAVSADLFCGLLQAGEQGRYGPAGIIIGNAETGELLALKKISQFNTKTKTEMIFFEVPETKSILTVYIISDSYLGLDQTYDIIIDPQE